MAVYERGYEAGYEAARPPICPRAEALRAYKPDSNEPSALALASEALPKRGRPKKNDHPSKAAELERLRRQYEERDKRPYNEDAEVMRELVIEVLMEKLGCTRNRAISILDSRAGWGVRLRTKIESQLRYVRTGRAAAKRI
jgi:hypothetical protein